MPTREREGTTATTPSEARAARALASAGRTPARLLRALHGKPRGERLRMEPGTLADFDALAPLHYHAARPAVRERIMTLRGADGAARAVLVLSRPTLNASWREAAWPGRFSGGGREAAAKINADLRTISRVIVDPRYRGCGLAVRLVRACLRESPTPCTEAVAAMGAWCPFFERAGMRAWELPDTARDRTLRRALERLSLTPFDLTEQEASSVAEGAVRAWARASRATRRIAGAPMSRLAPVAAQRLIAPPVAFTHEKH